METVARPAVYLPDVVVRASLLLPNVTATQPPHVNPNSLHFELNHLVMCSTLYQPVTSMPTTSLLGMQLPREVIPKYPERGLALRWLTFVFRDYYTQYTTSGIPYVLKLLCSSSLTSSSLYLFTTPFAHLL